LPERAGRVAIDRYVLSYGQRGVRTVVIRPSLIYGDGLGAKRDSIQVPRMEALARDKGVPLHIGEGLNIWSNVHIEDVCDLYRLAIETAPAGSLFYAENGEASMRDLAQWIGRRIGSGGRAESWPMEDALATWGISALASFASNSRVRADKARAMLNWQPSGPSLQSVVEAGG
jgi:nucleoside-diphosphate-sugar epimerase